MGILGDFRRLVGAVEHLAQESQGTVGVLEAVVRALEELGAIQAKLTPALERLDALEFARHNFEAEVESMLLKAEGKLKAASNAEARERQLKRSYERADAFAPEGEERQEGRDAVLAVDAPGGEAEAVQPLHLDVARNNKAHAQRAKWGR